MRPLSHEVVEAVAQGVTTMAELAKRFQGRPVYAAVQYALQQRWLTHAGRGVYAVDGVARLPRVRTVPPKPRVAPSRTELEAVWFAP